MMMNYQPRRSQFTGNTSCLVRISGTISTARKCWVTTCEMQLVACLSAGQPFLEKHLCNGRDIPGGKSVSQVQPLGWDLPCSVSCQYTGTQHMNQEDGALIKDSWMLQRKHREKHEH